MVFAASHVVAAIGLSSLVNRYFPSLVSRRGYALASLGALVPDFDFLLVLLFGDMGWHRAFSNFFLIPFVIAALGFVLFPKYRMEVFLFSLGYLSHIILDFIHTDILILGMIDGIVITILVVIFLGLYWKEKEMKEKKVIR